MRIDDHQPVAGETLELWYEDQLVGTLRRSADTIVDLEFTYAQAWLASPGAFQISTTLPLQAAPHPPVLVYPWFVNLLPEGEALQIIGTILKVNQLDVMGMLRQMGGDLPGALMVMPPDGQADPHFAPLSNEQLADAIRRLPERPLLVGEQGVHMSLAGAQDKLAVVRYRDGSLGLALDGAPSTYILKPANRNYHASVENEAFCLRLAAAIGLPAAKASIQSVEDIKYLLVERYDRTKDPAGVHRIHQEDLCQATGFLPYQKYEWNAAVQQRGPGVKACLDALGATATPAANKLAFLDYLIFNIVCGNVDAHAKNYSILLLPGGEQRLAPIYDVMNGDIYQNVTKNMAMKIGGKQRGDHLHGRHWDRLAEENELSARGVRSRVARISTDILKALPGVVDELDAASPSLMYNEISSHIARHCKNMIANLKTEPAAADADDGDDHHHGDNNAHVEVRPDEADPESILISP